MNQTSSTSELEKYEKAIQKTLIAHFASAYFETMDPQDFVEILHRLFKRKRKAMRNLAAHVRKEVEENGHPIEGVLESLGFFAIVLKDMIDKNLNQPFKR